MKLLNMMQAKESGQAVEHAVVFAKVYCKKDGTPISDGVRDKIEALYRWWTICFVFCALNVYSK